MLHPGEYGSRRPSNRPGVFHSPMVANFLSVLAISSGRCWCWKSTDLSSPFREQRDGLRLIGVLDNHAQFAAAL
ncbi:MAG: hypothetical protein HND48_19140 [Chloroflexi bacterium]|nr:hypothetical protein [Chloroflexota bacterium]